jgi:hypothetical protein
MSVQMPRPWARGMPTGARTQSGFALFGVVVLTCIMLLLVLSVLTFGSLDAGLAKNRAAKSCAFYLAEGGLARGVAWLQAQSEPPSGIEAILPFGDAPDSVGHGAYLVSIVPDSLNGILDRPRYTIISTGNVDGQTRSLELGVRVELFTDFLYFTDREHEPGTGAPIWFHSGDVIDGPLFTNDQICIQGDPTFANIAVSAYGGAGDTNPTHAPGFLYYNGDQFNNVESAAESNPPHDYPDFQDGSSLGARHVEYPSHQLTDDIALAAGISVSGTYEIILARPHDVTGEPMHGYVSYRKPGQGNPPWMDVQISSFNGLFYVNGSFDVSGIIDGALTLATNGSIRIVDDVTYRDSDEGGPTVYCDDVLGLIAGTDITVSDNAANQDDCVIHAAMVALDNCFRAEDWASGPLRGYLTVHGSIIQSYRGAVGTSVIAEDEETLLTGYAKDYHYDWRLLEVSPPQFSVFFDTGEYGRLRWREV